MTFKELEDLNIEYLDTLNLDKYMNASDDVKTIIDMIEDDYDGIEDMPIELEGCVFNYLDNEDIAYYLANRYGKCVFEEVVYKLHIL